MNPIRRLLVACLATFLALPLPAADAPGKAAIATAHPLATEAGMEILAKGGNAFDAAVAVSAALAVVEPKGSGLGGGGFYLLHRAGDGKQVFLDAREVAPSAATRDMYLDAAGNVVEGLSTRSAKAAGIPGEPAAFDHLAKNYGRLPLATSMGPAIRLAREGYPLYEKMLKELERALREERLLDPTTAEFARIFLVDRKMPPVGHVVRQPELAKSLEVVPRRAPRVSIAGRSPRGSCAECERSAVSERAGSRRLPRGRARAARHELSRRAHRERAAAVIGRCLAR